MTKTIPAQTIITCDICKKDNPVRKRQAVLTMKRDALDYMGDPSADGTYTLDLCDSCETTISELINKLFAP